MTENQLATVAVPSSPESEEALLGAIFFKPDLIGEIEKEIRIDDFYIVRNAWVYEIMLNLHHRQESIDEMSVYVELKNFYPQRLKDMGGSAYVTRLISNTPTYQHYWTYVKTIQEASGRRKVLTFASQIASAVIEADRGTVDRTLQQALETWRELSRSRNELSKYLIAADDLEHLPPPQWLVPGEIPESGLTVLYGASGVGKSFLALDYALRLAQKCSVLYVAAEGQYGYKARVEAWKKHYRLSGGRLTFYMNLIALLDSQERENFKSAIEHLRPQLIVVDTLAYSLLPGDENSTRDMGIFVSACNALIKELCCTVMLIHHTGIEGNRVRGSTVLTGAADTMIRLSGDDDQIIVECTKSKDSKPFEPRYMKLLPVALPNGESVPVIVPTEKVITGPDDPLTNNQMKVLRTISESFPFGATPSDIVDTCGLYKGATNRILGKLVKLGHLSQAYAKEPYQITPNGLSKVAQSLNSVKLGLASSTPDSFRDSVLDPDGEHRTSQDSQVSPSFQKNDERVQRVLRVLRVPEGDSVDPADSTKLHNTESGVIHASPDNQTSNKQAKKHRFSHIDFRPWNEGKGPIKVDDAEV